jgi:hypothetical protein
MTFNDEILQQIRAQSKEIRAGRKVPILVLSGVTGGTAHSLTEEVTGGTSVWITASGTVSLMKQPHEFQIVGGRSMPSNWYISFDAEEIRGYEHAMKFQYGGRDFNLVERRDDQWGPHITHVDFIVMEGD